MDNNEISIHFKTAANKILHFLHERFGFQLWSITRVNGNHWVMLVTRDDGYNVEDGDMFVWSDSFCFRMVQSLGPQIAPRVKEIEAYASAPINKDLPISAYIGVPLKLDDGRLFGTLCAIDPVEQPDSLKDELPLISLFAELISQIIQADMKTQKLINEVELARLNSYREPTTNLYNSEAWNILLAKEQERCDVFSSPAMILIIKVNDTRKNETNYLLEKISDYLNKIFRLSDIKAYLGNNTFAVLAIEIDHELTEDFITRIQCTLTSEKIPVDIGWAEHDPKNRLIETQAIAEKNISPLQ